MTYAPDQPLVRPRKNPTQPRSRATVDAVLDAAAHILEDQGLAAFNTNAVAERAGVSIGSLYQYFPSKDAILVSLIERESEGFARQMTEAADSVRGRSIGDDMRDLLRIGLSYHRRRPSLVRLLDAEARRLEININCASAHTASRAAMSRMLARHRDAIQADDMALAAQEVGAIAKALMENAAERDFASQGQMDWDVVIERTVRAILGYLGAERGVAQLAAE